MRPVGRNHPDVVCFHISGKQNVKCVVRLPRQYQIAGEVLVIRTRLDDLVAPYGAKDVRAANVTASEPHVYVIRPVHVALLNAPLDECERVIWRPLHADHIMPVSLAPLNVLERRGGGMLRGRRPKPGITRATAMKPWTRFPYSLKHPSA